MSDTNLQPKKPLSDEYLTIREHLDMDKHWIGEALPVPSLGEIATSVGTATSTPGDSPIPARADHNHMVDPSLLPRLLSWTPTLANFGMGSTGGANYTAVEAKLSATIRMIYIEHYAIVSGTGTLGPTGDVSVTLPVAPLRFAKGDGHYLTGSNRFELVPHTVVSGSTTLAIRPRVYRPTATVATQVTDIGDRTLANTANPTIPWAANDYLYYRLNYMAAI